MQPLPTPHWPDGWRDGALVCISPRTPPGTPARGRSRTPVHPRRHVGPTLVFTGVALCILGTATMLATCIASFG